MKIKHSILATLLLQASCAVPDSKQSSTSAGVLLLPGAAVEILQKLSSKTLGSFEQELIGGVSEAPAFVMGQQMSSIKTSLVAAFARPTQAFPRNLSVRELWAEVGFAPEEGVIRGDLVAALERFHRHQASLGLTFVGPAPSDPDYGPSTSAFTTTWAKATPTEQCALAGEAFQDAGLGTVFGGGCNGDGGNSDWQWPALLAIQNGEQSCLASAKIWIGLQYEQDPNVPDIYTTAMDCPGLNAANPASPLPIPSGGQWGQLRQGTSVSAHPVGPVPAPTPPH